jgi:hypothetical protein
MSPAARKVVTTLRGAGIEIVDCQTVIYSHELRLATAIDMLGYMPTTGQLVVLELKTGFVDYVDVASDLNRGVMAGVLGTEVAMPDSAANQHQLQVWLSKEMLVREYGVPRSEVRTLVVHVPRPKDADGPVNLLPFPGQFTDACPAAYAELVKVRAKAKRAADRRRERNA